MDHVKLVLASALLLSFLASANVPIRAQERRAVELNSILMESTFRIEGKNTRGQDTVGTCFVLGRPYPKEPNKLRYLLVTAAHVLADIHGEYATVVMRRKHGDSRWERTPVPIRIRLGDHPLWTQHSQADVAVMYIRVPDGVLQTVVPTGLLADDKSLAEFEIHPGDELSCLGYPFGAESNPAGFPILRSGKISSYPLLPTTETKVFLFDFRIFGGNSGGPVYFVQTNRTYGGSTQLGTTIQFLMGIVSNEKVLKQQIEEPYSKREQNYPLGLAEVVHASLIKETIELLPSPDQVPD